MGAVWLIAGFVLGMGVAWAAEYWLDWRYRPRDAALDSEVGHALRYALSRSEAENSRLRNELMLVRAQLAAAQNSVGSSMEVPPV